MVRVLLGILLASSFAASIAAGGVDVKLLRDRPASDRPELLFIGTPHFGNPGLDVIKSKTADVMGAARQAEINDLVNRLTKFQPTIVAIEWPHSDQDKLDTRYANYQGGRYTLARDEVDQIALRLAAKLGLKKVYAVDWNEMPPGVLADYDYETFATDAGQADRLSAIRNRPADMPADWMSTHTVLDWLRRENTSDMQAHMQSVYFDYALIGDDSHYPGANWVGSWYGRNLKIFSNLVKLSAGPNDRVLVIYGGGHGFLLKQFASESGAYKVIDPAGYLGN